MDTSVTRSAVANPSRGARNATMDLFATALEVDGHTVASARKTHKGWYWFSNLGRAGRKLDFPDKKTALQAAAKALGLNISTIVPDAAGDQGMEAGNA